MTKSKNFINGKITDPSVLAIPQHKLINKEGQPVDFDFSVLEKPDQEYPYEKPHRHDFYEIILFNEGGGTHDIDFTTYEIKSRSVHFIASDNVHLILRNKNSCGYSLLFTSDYFDKGLINQLPFSRANPVFELDEQVFLLINDLIGYIKKEWLAEENGFESMIKSYMNTILLNLRRHYFKQDPQQEAKIVKPQLISNFMYMVQQQYTNHYNVEHYAEKLNISSKHLIELCKIHIGKTPLTYIRDHTISEAKRLLFYTQLSIKEIAYKLNFDDPANFSKYFKTATGYSPIEYREGIR